MPSVSSFLVGSFPLLAPCSEETPPPDGSWLRDLRQWQASATGLSAEPLARIDDEEDLMRNKMKMAGVAAAALLALGACGGQGEESAAGATTEANGSTPTESTVPAETGAEVTLQTFRFEPGDIEVAPGTTVEWTNEDDILHTVTSGQGQEQGVPGVSKDKDAKPDGLFDQQMDGVGATFTFTFDDAGKYSYYCAIHPGMTGTVTVR
jgi:plastocyanin